MKITYPKLLTVGGKVDGSTKPRAIISNCVTHILKAIIAVLNWILVCFIEHGSAWLMRALNVLWATIYEMDASNETGETGLMTAQLKLFSHPKVKRWTFSHLRNASSLPESTITADDWRTDRNIRWHGSPLACTRMTNEVATRLLLAHYNQLRAP